MLSYFLDTKNDMIIQGEGRGEREVKQIPKLALKTDQIMSGPEQNHVTSSGWYEKMKKMIGEKASAGISGSCSGCGQAVGAGADEMAIANNTSSSKENFLHRAFGDHFHRIESKTRWLLPIMSPTITVFSAIGFFVSGFYMRKACQEAKNIRVDMKSINDSPENIGCSERVKNSNPMKKILRSKN